MPLQPQTDGLPSLRLAMVILLVSGCANWNQKPLVGGGPPSIVRAQNLDQPFPQEFIDTPANMEIIQSPTGQTLTLDQPDLPPIALREAIAMALRQSEVVRTLDGIESVTGFDPTIAESFFQIAVEHAGTVPAKLALAEHSIRLRKLDSARNLVDEVIKSA